MEVFTDEVALQSIKPDSKSVYERAWNRMAGLLAPAPGICSSVPALPATVQLPGDPVEEKPKQHCLTTPGTSKSMVPDHTDQIMLSDGNGQPGLFKSIENNNKVIVISNCHGVVINYFVFCCLFIFIILICDKLD